MIDIAGQIKAIHRQVGRQTTASGEDVCVLLQRTYEAAIEDVWDALTDPDRVKRWFLPVSGDLRAGGSFQLEGNAGGEILACEPPRLLKVTFGGPTSIVELRLSSNGDSDTLLELEHTVPIEMAGSGAGALYVGPGWDGAFMALGLFLAGEISDDPVAAGNSPEGQEFSMQSVHVWANVVESSGTATADDIAAATDVSLAQFAPDLTTTQNDDESHQST
ncbi:MAG: SRPBCC family protein [Dehalococcoidia bacterium]